MTKTVVISGGHYGPYTGASDIVDEVTEAWKIAKQVAKLLRAKGITVYEFYDTVSKNQDDNLDRIVAFHNSKERNLDLSFHLNATVRKKEGIGCETLYYDALSLAKKITDAICAVTGFKNRGAKERKELFFLRKTDEKAVLLEPFFVSSEEDVRIYKESYNAICEAIANAVADHLGVKITTVSKPAENTSIAKSYYKSGTGLYRIKKGCYLYKTIKFDKAQRAEKIEPGEAVTANEIVKYGSAYRLKTKYGYVTADKEFVEKV